MIKTIVGENSVIYREGKRRVCWKRHVVSILVVIALVFIFTGILCVITEVFQDWVKDEIKEGVVLKPGKEVYRKWRHPKSPSYMTYYLFNVTNAKEVASGGIPNLQQLGPYTYREISGKDVLMRHEYSHSSITYLSKKYYLYDKDMSCENCDPMVDNVTNVNLPFLATIETIINYILANNPKTLPFAMKVLDETFKKAGVKAFQTLTVHELLWGYEDPALSKAHAILLLLARTEIDRNIKVEIPKKFALQKNKTATLYTIDSGEFDVDNVGKCLKWNNKPNLSCWNSISANMINGTGGKRFKPYISKEDEVYVFVTSLFRSFKLIYDSIVHVRRIKLYRFTLDPDLFVTGDVDEKNKGFCVSGKGKKCLPSGLMNIGQCFPQSAPIVASLPHFYLGNVSLLKSVKGMKPSKPIHATFIDIEPHTGLTMQGNKRIQMNVAVHSIDGLTAFRNWTKVYLPLVYINEHGRISEDDADDFKTDVLLPLRLAEAAPFMLIGVGCTILLAASVIWYRRHRKGLKKSTGISGEEVPLLSDTTKLHQKTYLLQKS